MIHYRNFQVFAANNHIVKIGRRLQTVFELFPIVNIPDDLRSRKK